MLERLRRQRRHAGGHRLRSALRESLEQLLTRLAQLITLRVLTGGTTRTLTQSIQVAFALEHVHRNRIAVTQTRGQLITVRSHLTLQVRDIQGDLQLIVNVVVGDTRVLLHELQNRVQQLMRVRQRVHRRRIQQSRSHQLLNARLNHLRQSRRESRTQRVDGLALREVVVGGQHIVEVILRVNLHKIGVRGGLLDALVAVKDLLQARKAQLHIGAMIVESVEQKNAHMGQQGIGCGNILSLNGGVFILHQRQHGAQLARRHAGLFVAFHEVLRGRRQRVQSQRRVRVLVNRLGAQVALSGQQAQRLSNHRLNNALLQVRQTVPALHKTALAQHQLANLHGRRRGVGGGHAQNDGQKLTHRNVREQNRVELLQVVEVHAAEEGQNRQERLRLLFLRGAQKFTARLAEGVVQVARMQLAEGHLKIVSVDQRRDQLIECLTEENIVTDRNETLSHVETQVHTYGGVHIGEENLLATVLSALKMAEQGESRRNAESACFLG